MQRHYYSHTVAEPRTQSALLLERASGHYCPLYALVLPVMLAVD